MLNYIDRDGVLMREKIIRHALVGFVALVLIFGSFGTINAGERGVKTRLGALVGTVEPGLYFGSPAHPGAITCRPERG